MSAEAVQEAHERLCFARAFPRSAAELRRTLKALDRFESRARRYKDDLENTGIAGTLYRYPFNHTMATWLAMAYGRGVEIDWVAYKKHTWDEMAGMLSQIVAWAENEGLDDDDVGSWDWIKGARGHRGTGAQKRGHRGTGAQKTDLQFVLERLAQRGDSMPMRRHLYEACNVPLVWDLAGNPDSVTHARLPVKRVFYAPVSRERPADFAAAVREGAGGLELLQRRRAETMIHAARVALSQREREFHVIVHANPDEVYRVDAGRGLEIIVFGLTRPERLTLEADYGALLVRNGVPIGYGYAALVLDRADIAINIFPTYRAGESTHVFTKFCAVFAQHFAARKLIMRRYQLGWQNPEGIEAGSFWFYYKLGFRSVDPKVRAFADAEAARLARRKGARSGESTLRRLARSDMVLATDGTPVETYRDVALKEIGQEVTRMIERRYAGDRARAVADCERRVSRLVGRNVTGCRLAPVVALIPDLARWPREDRAALGRLLRLKEAVRERGFVLAMLRHERVHEWLADAPRPVRGSAG